MTYNKMAEKKPIFRLSEILVLFSMLILLIVVNNDSINKYLFTLLNSHAYFLSDNLMVAGSFIFSPRNFIVPAIMLLGALIFDPKKWSKVIVGIIIFYVFFTLTKFVFSEPRPYIVLPANSFHFLANLGDMNKDAFMSYPSAHTGMAAFLVCYINRMVFKRSYVLKFLAFFLILYVGAIRVMSGWHWPCDVVAGAIFGYVIAYISCKYVSRDQRVSVFQ